MTANVNAVLDLMAQMTPEELHDVAVLIAGAERLKSILDATPRKRGPKPKVAATLRAPDVVAVKESGQ